MSVQVVKSASVNGDAVDWIIKPCNDSTIECKNGRVEFTIPSGMSMTGPSDEDSTIINVPVGFYDRDTTTWYFGDLAAKTCTPTATFTLTVDNTTLADPEDLRFIIIATFITTCDETTSSDNTNTLIINIVDDCTNVQLSVSTTPNQNSSDITVS